MKNQKEHPENLKKQKPETARRQQKPAKAKSDKWILRLYVAGTTPQSVSAIANIKEICEEHLKGRYDLEVIDLYKNPGLAKGEQIIAAPTLIKKLPLPLRRLIGDLSRTERVLVGLDIMEVKKSDVSTSLRE
jgi:circadian clock protein KaiB